MAGGRANETRSGSRPLARRLAGLSAAAAAPGIAAMAAGAAAGLVDPMAALLGAGVACGGAGVAVWQVWRTAGRIDALAERLAAEAGVQTVRTDTASLIAAAFAAVDRRMAALVRSGDPARRDDPETGLPNRQTVLRRGRDEITRARRNQHPLAVGLLSIVPEDDAAVAAEPGRRERMLRLTAEIAMQGLRAYDIVGRWDGDVFIAVIPEAEIEHATTALERVRTMIAGHPMLRPGDVVPVLHAGVAVLQPDDATIADIAARAQRALDRARSGVGAAIQAAPGPRQRPVQLTSV